MISRAPAIRSSTSATRPKEFKSSSGATMIIDATAMCRAYGKLFADYRRLENTEEFLMELAADLNMVIPILVQSAVGGRHSGTWVHPEVAVDLAQWLSPKFRVLVNRWVFQWMQGRQPAFHKDDVEPFVVGRLVQKVEEIHSKVSRIADTTERIDRTTVETWISVATVAHKGSVYAEQIELELPVSPPKESEPHPGDWRTWRLRKKA